MRDPRVVPVVGDQIFHPRRRMLYVVMHAGNANRMDGTVRADVFLSHQGEYNPGGQLPRWRGSVRNWRLSMKDAKVKVYGGG